MTLLLEAIYQFYGYDFRNYAYSSIRRRIWHRTHAEKLQTVSELLAQVLHDQDCLKRLLSDFSITVTEMFRDPSFFYTLRTKVVPFLRTYPFIRIWHAGCSTGEEVYSMAILLKEEGLYERARIYATDMNEEVLEQAKRGIFPLERMQIYTNNYLQSGGKEAFSQYYTAHYEGAKFHRELIENVVFSKHNLAVDQSFNEFNVVLCRNVMIYFNSTLKDRVHELFYNSLSSFGILGLGNREAIAFTKVEPFYEEIDRDARLYRKVK